VRPNNVETISSGVTSSHHERDKGRVVSSDKILQNYKGETSTRGRIAINTLPLGTIVQGTRSFSSAKPAAARRAADSRTAGNKGFRVQEQDRREEQTVEGRRGGVDKSQKSARRRSGRFRYSL
jgi:hypothetical protein